MKTALVITTYNNPRTLGICLKSLTNQTRWDFDIFIADDGSKEETAAKIASFKPAFRDRLHHVWHPDEGYRKSEINNTVFRKLANYDVVICVDHDVILHHHFVEDHLSIHEENPNACFMGRRVELGRGLSATINEGNVTQFNAGVPLRLFVSGLRGDSSHVNRGIRIASPKLQVLLGRTRVPDLLGSNFSIARSLLYQINGYNEDYRSYWGEDGDLFVRIRNSGAKIIGIKGFAIQYHLDHPRLEPDSASQLRYTELLKDTSYVRCKNGIEK